MKEEKVYFSSGGLKLCGLLSRPKKRTGTCIVLCHGITVTKDEDGGFVGLAKALNKSGFAVFRFDFRGHGESEGDSADMTARGEEHDLSSAVQFLKEKGYDKFGIVGASFGAGAATLYTTGHQDSVKALAFWYPLIDYHNILKPELTWPKKYFNKDAMKKLEDVGCIRVGSRHFKIGKRLIEEMRKLEPWKALKDVKIPVLFVHGDKDEYVSYGDSVKYSRMFKAELATIEGGDHGLREGNEGEVVDRITAEWFLKHLR